MNWTSILGVILLPSTSLEARLTELIVSITFNRLQLATNLKLAGSNLDFIDNKLCVSNQNYQITNTHIYNFRWNEQCYSYRRLVIVWVRRYYRCQCKSHLAKWRAHHGSALSTLALLMLQYQCILVRIFKTLLNFQLLTFRFNSFNGCQTRCSIERTVGSPVVGEWREILSGKNII